MFAKFVMIREWAKKKKGCVSMQIDTEMITCVGRQCHYDNENFVEINYWCNYF